VKLFGGLLLAAAVAVATHFGDARPAQAHQSGCHAAHSCPSDSGSYVCGDTGNYTYCPAAPPPALTPTPTPAPAPAPAPTYTPPLPQARVIRARITAVVDGDTIKVRTDRGKRYSVRLIGIDTPETRKPGTPIECGGKQATASLQRLAFSRGVGRRVTLTTDPTQRTYDRYRRLLAYAKTSTSQLNAKQVSRGWAAVYVFEKPFSRLAAFERAQSQARAADRGVWGSCAGDFHRAA